MTGAELVALVDPAAELASVGLLVGIFYRVGNLSAVSRFHDARLSRLEGCATLRS